MEKNLTDNQMLTSFYFLELGVVILGWEVRDTIEHEGGGLSSGGGNIIIICKYLGTERQEAVHSLLKILYMTPATPFVGPRLPQKRLSGARCSPVDLHASEPPAPSGRTWNPRGRSWPAPSWSWPGRRTSLENVVWANAFPPWKRFLTENN